MSVSKKIQKTALSPERRELGLGIVMSKMRDETAGIALQSPYIIT
jgi:hypothetical protein